MKKFTAGRYYYIGAYKEATRDLEQDLSFGQRGWASEFDGRYTFIPEDTMVRHSVNLEDLEPMTDRQEIVTYAKKT